jgi:hypothetical protein
MDKDMVTSCYQINAVPGIATYSTVSEIVGFGIVFIGKRAKNAAK